MLRYKKSIGLVIIIVVIASILIVISKRKLIKITGYKYRAEIIKIDVLKNQFNNLNPSNCDSNNICFFYETKIIYQYFKEMRLHIVLDSLGFKNVDTILTISRANKRPVISFKDPLETMPNRSLFLFDESDKRIILP